MDKMSLRERLFHATLSMKGIKTYEYLKQIQAEDALCSGRMILESSLSAILLHCRRHVPYYARLINSRLSTKETDPFKILSLLPVLYKNTLREKPDQLKSDDIGKRKWFYNTSGGSTGEPVRFIQDKYYLEMTNAIAELFTSLAGRKPGSPKFLLWGSERDIIKPGKDFKKVILNSLGNTIWLNAFLMTPHRMRTYINLVNNSKKGIIIAYAQAAYELACFASNENVRVTPPLAMITSAGTLYPFMREKIEGVFCCPVFNRYGSREVGLIAAERPGADGMIVPPWSTYVEILDQDGNNLKPGMEGEIVVTNLLNYAMPLIRYSIGDRGALMEDEPIYGYQRIKKISGRNVDTFIRRDGTLVDGEYFTHLLYFRDWIDKFQVVQTGYDEIIYKIVTARSSRLSEAREEIAARTRLALGDSCRVHFEVMEHLPPSSSGKYRYTISLVPRENS